MAPARLNPAPASAKRTTSEMRTVVGIASATVADDMSHIAAAKIAAAMGGGTLSASVVAEAAQRGHEVNAVSRSGGMTKGASRAAAMELSDTSAMSAAIDASDAT